MLGINFSDFTAALKQRKMNVFMFSVYMFTENKPEKSDAIV